MGCSVMQALSMPVLPEAFAIQQLLQSQLWSGAVSGLSSGSDVISTQAEEHVRDPAEQKQADEESEEAPSGASVCTGQVLRGRALLAVCDLSASEGVEKNAELTSDFMLEVGVACAPA
jgi:hypothetical protein